jgi:hypothetical protein
MRVETVEEAMKWSAYDTKLHTVLSYDHKVNRKELVIYSKRSDCAKECSDLFKRSFSA